jgi:pyruvate dehydrogenase E2 component (dihydrolipoamide acetyltransferase)
MKNNDNNLDNKKENQTQEQKEIIKLSPLRKTISKKMIISKTIIPDATLMNEINVSELVNLRKKYKPEADKKQIKLTYMPFIAKVIISALKEFPILNSKFDDEKDEIIINKQINLGIAIDTAQGLIVPNLKKIEELSIFQLAQEIQKIVQTTLDRKLQLNQIQNGTFTLSNYGSVGVMYATPIINHPELAILGIGSIFSKVILKNQKIETASFLPLSLTFDHRIIDGAYAGRFLKKISELLNNIPELEKNIF